MKKFYVVLSVLALSASMTVATARADLVSRYTFDNTAANAVNGAPNGTVHGGAAYVAGPTSGPVAGTSAVSFDGTGNQYVDCTTGGFPNASNGLWTGSLAFWIKDVNSSVAQYVINASNTADVQDFSLYITATGGLDLSVRSTDGSDLEKALPTAAIFDGGWHHVAATWNVTTGTLGTGTMAMYVDGVAQSLTTTYNNFTSAKSFTNWGNPMRIGIGGRADPPTWIPPMAHWLICVSTTRC